ncbi:enoyl-CoA hydratase-related protein [Mangrovicoccus algicola]|uniref:Enoyl-CoA hydratase/isomerase family protein n=1 Tax=Mangrovicoccus algicola TaxID=2771008 RepID=A0A8J7CKR0_9RHOB|nr:enoyl-CoA hydratase-related protein [Mangrovicoccus algicola]MBE3639151.1 enoyl-CoA hydratase/isomerase family protein [Mangrovicoccus algicola]
MAYETLIVEVDDHIAQIRLNRPDAKNSLNKLMVAELTDALQAAERNDKARCIMLTGSEKVFCAGADVSELAEASFADLFCGNYYGPDAEPLVRCRKPVVAAVSGYAVGAGCELAMMADLVIAADTAKFGLPDVNLGVIPALGGTQRLVRAIGKAKAMDMLLTGRFMSAEEAERAGLVSRVVPAKKLAEESRTAASRIAEKSMVGTRAVKEAVNRAFETPLREGLLYERRMFHAMFGTNDQKEGMAAYLEKREAQFRDK